VIIKKITNSVKPPSRIPTSHRLRVIPIITWIYRKCGCFGLVRDFLMPLIRDSRNDFSTSEFARLSQAIPPEEVTPAMTEVQSTLRTQLSEMGRRELLYFMLGSIHLGNLEVEETPGSLLHECMQVVRDEQDNFKPEEVERMTIISKFCCPTS